MTTPITSLATFKATRRAEPVTFEELLTPGDVARMLNVGPKSVTRWANKGLLNSVRTPGGHRRFIKAEVLALIEASRQERTS